MADEKKTEVRPALRFALLSKEDLRAAIQGADAKTVQEIATEIEAYGYSREGQMYSAVLERRQQLGETLSDEDAALLESIQKKVAKGAALPPITGQAGKEK